MAGVGGLGRRGWTWRWLGTYLSAKKERYYTYLDGVHDDMEVVDIVTGLSALLQGWS